MEYTQQYFLTRFLWKNEEIKESCVVTERVKIIEWPKVSCCVSGWETTHHHPPQASQTQSTLGLRESSGCPMWKALVRTVLVSYFESHPIDFFPLVESPFGRSWCHGFGSCGVVLNTCFLSRVKVNLKLSFNLCGPSHFKCRTSQTAGLCILRHGNTPVFEFSHPRIHHDGCSIFTRYSVLPGVGSTR